MKPTSRGLSLRVSRQLCLGLSPNGLVPTATTKAITTGRLGFVRGLVTASTKLALATMKLVISRGDVAKAIDSCSSMVKAMAALDGGAT